jgi:hypothetical protein
VPNTDKDQTDVGHKRSLKSVWDTMRAEGENVEELWEEIKRMVIKTICSAQPVLQHHYKTCQPEEYYQHMCFEVLGFDFLVNAKMKPMLLEINHTPSFATDSPFDKDVKSKLIHDTLVLMNVSPKMKKKLLTMKKKELENRVLTGKRVKRTQEERELIHKKCQMERDEYIYKNLGDYEVVYPYKNKEDETEPYDQFIEVARKLYLQSTGGDRKTVKKDDVVKVVAPPGQRESSSNNVLTPGGLVTGSGANLAKGKAGDGMLANGGSKTNISNLNNKSYMGSKIVTGQGPMGSVIGGTGQLIQNNKNKPGVVCSERGVIKRDLSVQDTVIANNSGVIGGENGMYMAGGKDGILLGNHDTGNVLANLTSNKSELMLASIDPNTVVTEQSMEVMGVLTETD